MKAKKIISLFTAIFTALSITITTQAEDVELKDTKQVCGFECWGDNGMYYTYVDGEVCQVIDLNDLPAQAQISTCSLKSEDSVLSTNEKINYYIDLSDGHTYQGRIDITNGDCTTPTFYAERNCPKATLEVSTKFVLPTTYYVTVYYNYLDEYDNVGSGWTNENKTLTFYFPIQCHRFYIGTGVQAAHVCKMTFHKEGSSTSETNFLYWVKLV